MQTTCLLGSQLVEEKPLFASDLKKNIMLNNPIHTKVHPLNFIHLNPWSTKNNIVVF